MNEIELDLISGGDGGFTVNPDGSITGTGEQIQGINFPDGSSINTLNDSTNGSSTYFGYADGNYEIYDGNGDLSYSSGT